MAVSARLSRVLHHQLGDDAGEDLVNWMGQMESNRSELRDVMDGYITLTNSRFAEYDARMDARFAALDARVGSLDARMGGLAGEQTRLSEGLVVVKGELLAAIQRARADMILWSFVFWCATMMVVIAPRLLG